MSTSLLRLMTWLSPVFPVGAFSYSHGLERAVHDGLVADRAGLARWIGDLVTMGSGWNDAVLAAESWRRVRAGDDLDAVAELAEALAGSAERHMETMQQGAAFLQAAAAWPHPVLRQLRRDTAYPVAVGAVAAAGGIGLGDTMAAYCHAFASNMAHAAIRLGVIGQIGGVAILAGLEAQLLATAESAAISTLDDLGSATIMSEIMAMKHETQHSRLFRS